MDILVTNLGGVPRPRVLAEPKPLVRIEEGLFPRKRQFLLNHKNNLELSTGVIGGFIIGEARCETRGGGRDRRQIVVHARFGS